MMLRKILLAVAVVCVLAGYCALPLTSVATVTITVTDQNGRPITENVVAAFLDAADREIATVALGALPSWGNNLHLWSHSADTTSTLRPDDVRRTARVRINARNCAPLTIQAALNGHYVAPSPMPHGGGPAYMRYSFERTVQVRCGV